MARARLRCPRARTDQTAGTWKWTCGMCGSLQGPPARPRAAAVPRGRTWAHGRWPLGRWTWETGARPRLPPQRQTKAEGPRKQGTCALGVTVERVVPQAGLGAAVAGTTRAHASTATPAPRCAAPGLCQCPGAPPCAPLPRGCRWCCSRAWAWTCVGGPPVTGTDWGSGASRGPSPSAAAARGTGRPPATPSGRGPVRPAAAARGY
mmetsp:Transcript_49170/g.82441  ORF Transcript_49170/g.82441 Transcript_49170/m.82441 type:complete len:206 (+) Transcript_49170:1968-2585(+)